VGPVLPGGIVRVNPQPDTEVREAGEELAAAPGVALLMQQMQLDEPPAFPPPLPSAAGMHFDTEESSQGGERDTLF